MYNPKRQINLDISNKCGLACPACDRQSLIRNKQKISGSDISLESMSKIIIYFDHIIFCGQVSDPTHHDQFKDILKMCLKKNKKVTVNVASTFRDIKFFTSCFLLSRGKDIEWRFAIDGLPKDSHKYRINQDGEKLYEIMKKGSKLGVRCTWQYIVFNYNENDIDHCMSMAKDINVKFNKIISSRWGDDMKIYKPSNPENFITRGF
tara:strand:- start:633 stop:1250 length:618 start_codon:yes stop_codon:yes gene_type:complete